VTFRAGDIVRHKPSGEEWVLAVDEDGGWLSPAGWPDTIVRPFECELVTAATDAERLKFLRQVARSRDDRGGSDRRARIAQRQLQADAARGTT
jgi:hypothetical protein